MQLILNQLRMGQTLSENSARLAIENILDGQATPAQTGAFLMALSYRGETVDEIVAATKVLRERATTISSPENAIDCCGTGGDHSGSYNISTAVALVVASCGVPVAKHGNRAASSQCGAADILEHLGVNLDISSEKCEWALKQIGFCFLMAPRFHTSLKPLTALRKELGFRSLFNLLGPLSNPAGTQTQLIGVFDKLWVRPIAEVLKKISSKSALVVHGSDGLDEITLTGETYCAELKDGKITEYILSPDDFGLPPIRSGDIQGGNPQTNAKALMQLLQGEHFAYRDIVLANASAALKLSGVCNTYKQGVAIAGKAIDTGTAMTILQNYINLTNRIE